MFKKIFFSVLSTVCLLIVTITVAYAWYITKVADDFRSPLITGKSTAAYYAGGDGSKAKPYKIANERHLYNLAWLQYLGTYNKDYDEDGVVDQYYFEVINDIDCNDLVLPPIGTIDNPFLGNFDGNGYVIKNLSITNDYDNLVKKPSSINAESKFKGVEIIGFFGVIGKYAGFVDANISSEVNSAYDFNLDDLIIQNSSTNTLAGLVAGFVNANVSNVGVHYGKIELESGTKNISTFKNISGYTLIGDYDSELVSWEDKPSYDNGGGAQDFGGTLDFKTMHERFRLISENSWAFPTVSMDVANQSNANILDSVLTNRTYIPLVVDNPITESYYSKNTAEKTMSSNIGYLTGSSAYLEKAPVSDMIDDEFIVRDGNGKVTDVKVWTKTSTEHKEVTNTIDENIKNKLIKYVEDDYLYGIRFTAQISHNQPVTINNAVVDNTVINSINVPNSAIWFKPLVSGTAKIVSYQANSTRSLSFYEINRTDNSSFSTSFVKEEIYMNGVDWNQTFYYFEADVEAGHEYAIGSANGSDTAHFVYLDIGQNAGAGAPSVDPELKNSAIEGVDFVYLNHNTDEFSSTVDDYSSVFFQISGTTNGLTEFYFRRNNDNEDNYAGSEGIVLYFAKNENESSWTTTSSGRTDGSSSLDWSYAGTKGEAGDSGGYTAEDCEVLSGTKATGGLANTNTGASTTFTITYNYINENDEVVYITKGKVTKGYAITTPTFEVDGYRLIKWYTDESLNTEYDFSKAVDSNIILYASSEVVQTHIVTFKDGDTILATDVVNNGSYATITTPTKLGYVFSHWEDVDGNEVDIETTQITADLTLKAVWEDAYDITFAYNIGDDDVVIKTIQVKQGSKVVRPEEPELPGYKFVNWYTDKNYNSTFNYDNAPTGNITIYAKFDEIPHYTVTYGYMENSELVTIMVDSVEENTTPTKPDDPTREGYVFMGWFADEAFENEFDFSEEITANTVVYAYWQKGITITFQYEDGSVIETMSIMSNNTVTPTAIVPAKDGYRFDGNWYLFVDGVASNEAFDFETKLLDDTILVPGWIKTYDVTFVNNNNTSNTIMTVDTGQEVMKPTDPTYEGYKFVGWYSDIDCTIAQTFPITVTSDMTIYADWVQLITITLVVDGKESYVYTEENETITLPNSMDGYYLISWSDGVTTYLPGEEITVTGAKTYEANAVKKYTVTIKNGTTTIDTLTSDIDGHVTLPQALENGNAVFAGWSDGNTIYEASEVITVTSNMTINATWTYASSVVFDANGGKIGENETVTVQLTNGFVSQLPQDPTREEYVFTGWYLDSTCKIEYNENDPITVDTIYAGWEEEVQGVTYNFNYTIGTQQYTDVIVVTPEGELVYPTSITYGNITISVDGWYLGYSGYSKGNSNLTYSDILTTENISEGITLYPKGSNIVVLKVEANQIGGSNFFFVPAIADNTQVIDISSIYPTTFVNNGTTYYLENFVMNYWGNDKQYFMPLTSGNVYTTNGSNDCYLYANYTTTPTTKYTVTFETNGGSPVDSQQVVINGVVTKPTDPTKSGYVFEGWYSDSNLAYEYNFSTQVTSDITLYAKWTEIVPSNVTFDVDGETTILTTDANGYVSFPANPSKENHIFLGWYVGETKVDSNTKFIEDTTVVAKWQELFTITFVYDNGTDETVELTTNAEGKIDSLPIDPTYDGHRFLGWTYNSQTVTTSTVFAENATVTAEWIEVYTVTFNSNGGTEVASQTVDNGSYAVEPTKPTKSGYRFLGWFTDETCETLYNFSTAVTGNITLYAGWEEAQGYTITFNANEGELGNGSSVFEYTTSDTGMIPYSDFPTNPTREGYVFAGWYNNDKMYTSLDIFTDDITLNAKWHQTNKSVQLKYGYWTGSWGSFIEFEVAGLPTTIALNNSNSMMSAPTIIEVDGYTYQTMQRQYGDSITETDYIWSQVVYVTYEPTS